MPRPVLLSTALFCMAVLTLAAQEPAGSNATIQTTPPAPAAAAPESPAAPALPPPTPEPAEAPASETVPAPASPGNATTAATPEAPVVTSDEFSQKTLPPEPVRKPVPTSHGDRSGDIWVGHRAVVDRHAGWGWIKKENESWSRAKWVMIEEDPGKRMVPGRFHSRPTQDDNVQYKLYGEMADYKGYEPNYDVFVEVFRIRGWETIGPATRPAGLQTPRGAGGGPARWSERGANLRGR